MARIRIALGLASLALFGYLIWYNQSLLTPNGLPTFDGRPLGYDLDQTREYLRALSPEAISAYIGPVRLLDTAFPIVFAVFLALMLHHASRGWVLIPQLLLLLLPGAYLTMDLAENALVSQLLMTPLSDLRAGDVNLASHFTVTKYVTLLATVVAIGVAPFMGRR